MPRDTNFTDLFTGRTDVTSGTSAQTSAISHTARGAAAHPAGLSALAIAVISAATLMGAWYFQFFRDIVPCPMCLEQRYVYYFAIPFAALLAFAAVRGAPRALLLAGLALLALATLGNAGFGTYHAGVEWGFWPGPSSCTGPLLNLGHAGSLFDQLDKVKVVPCDVVQWRYLGISLAGYNALISLAMTAIAAWGMAKTARG
jgi:disulfide bond formation protein DsbB